MKVRWLIPIEGMVHGRKEGVAPGDVMELDDANAEHYLSVGYVTKYVTGDLPQPFQVGTRFPPNARDERFAAQKLAVSTGRRS